MSARGNAATRRLAAFMARLEAMIEQLDRRVNNIAREAKIVEIDAARALARVQAHGLQSFWAPWLERANPEGGIRTWSPPSVGERVLLLSPTGEPGQGLILRGGYSKGAKAPHDKPGEYRMRIGDTSVLIAKEKVEVVVGGDNGSCFEITGDFVRGRKGDARFVASQAAAKIRKGDTWVVTDGGNIIFSQPPIIGDDPDPN